MKRNLFMIVAVGLMLTGFLLFSLTKAVRKQKVNDRLEHLAKDFAFFEAAFLKYQKTSRTWPKSQLRGGALPEGMAPYFEKQSADWLQETPVGGHYYWSQNQLHNGRYYEAVISIENYDGQGPLRLNPSHLFALDERIDDGNLATGKFRLGRRDHPLFILKE